MNNNAVGLKWYKCDFHLHTCASLCFKDEENSLEKWIEEVKNKQLDCIAVTDHNTGESIDEVKRLGKENGIVVFPGVEITCGDAKVHLLVIFDIDKGKSDIEDFLIKCKINRSEFGKKNVYSNRTLTELLNIAKEDNALVIPSHIDDYNSLSQAGHIITKDFLSKEDVLGVQVVDSEFMNNNIKKESLLPIIKERRGNDKLEESNIKDFHRAVQLGLEEDCAMLTFSDNPKQELDSEHGLYGIGKRYTWIKMSENPNLESLRQALLMHNIRIKNDFISEQKPYREPNLWIKSISIQNTVITDNLKINFSPQMNTIIGGRGSGKSSILKFILGCLRKIDELEKVESIQNNFKEFFSINKNQSDEFTGVLNSDSVITIEINRDNILYTIKCYNFKTISKEINYETEIYYSNEANKLDVNIDEFIKIISNDIEIYLQKQVYEISKSTSALREKIDLRIKKDIEVIQSNLNKIKEKYISNKRNIYNKEQLLLNKNTWVSKLIDIDLKLNILNEYGLDKIIADINKFKSEEKILDRVKSQLINNVSNIKGIETKIRLLTLKIEDTDNLELKSIIDKISNENATIADRISEEINKYNEMISNLGENIKNTEWSIKYKQLEREFDVKVTDLQSKNIDISKYKEYLQEKDSLQVKLSEIEGLEDEIEELKLQNINIFKEYIDERKKITNLRNEFIQNSLQEKNIKLNIDVKLFRDNKYYIKEFRNIIQKQDNFKEDIDSIETYLFGSGYIVDKIKSLHNIISQIRKNEDVETIKLKPSFKNIIKNLNEEQLTSLELLIPEDTTEVKYKPSNSNSWVSLKTASAGQRTSSILSYILSSGTGPLILDQPEDDLDNKLIYDLIVDGMVKSKETRQIITVSHNANIPVNGDSEYVISLDYKEKGIEIHSNGPVEDCSVKKDIFDIMEGGEKAFEVRSKRYGF